MDGPQIDLLNRIDAGGIAEVFRGTLTSSGGLQKTVAVKRILPHLALDKGFRKIFQKEIFLIGQLKHPSIVQVNYSGEHHGYLYLVMEFIDGVNLTQLLVHCQENSLRIPVPVSCTIISRILRGLHYAYHTATDTDGRSLRVVHRDVNPRNIMLSYDGGVKVIDFGIAKALAHSQTEHSQGFRGTYGYCSPEQIRSEKIDHQTDIFSAGVVLWEMLSQRPLFAGKPHDILKKIVSEPSAPPSSLQADVPREIDQIVLKALHKRPEERFETARDFYRELNQATRSLYPEFDEEDISIYIKQIFEEHRAEQARARRNASSKTSDSFVMRTDAFLSYGHHTTLHSEGAKNGKKQTRAGVRSRSRTIRLMLLLAIPTLVGLAAGAFYFQLTKQKDGHTNTASNSVAAPSSIPGLVMWLKSNTLTGDTGTPIKHWTDHFNPQRAATNTFQDSQPFLVQNSLNGHSVVNFEENFLTSGEIQNDLKNASGITLVHISSSRGYVKSEMSVWSFQKAVSGDASGTQPNLTLLDYMRAGYGGGGKIVFGLSSEDSPFLTSSSTVAREMYACISYVITKNKVSIYVNGDRVLDETVSTPISFDALAQLTLGRSNERDGAAKHFKGFLADFLVFNKALEEKDIHKIEDFFSSLYTLDISTSR